MSRSTQQLKELTAGVHLVILSGFSAVKNFDGTLKVSESGEKAISVRFTDGFNKSFDKIYWVLGNREFEFNKVLSCAGIDRSKFSTFKEIAAEATGKRLWLCVREVYDIDEENMVLNESGQHVINYHIFDYCPCLNPEKVPFKKGNPQENNGIASDNFISYKQVGEIKGRSETTKAIMLATSTEYVHSNPTTITQETVATNTQMDNIWEATKPESDKKEIIAKAKEMIAMVESKVKEPKKSIDVINWDEL